MWNVAWQQVQQLSWLQVSRDQAEGETNNTASALMLVKHVHFDGMFKKEWKESGLDFSKHINFIMNKSILIRVKKKNHL